jgi:hypothetical protein
VIEGDGTVNQELANIANNNLDVVNILKRKAGETSQTASSRAEGVSPFKKPLAVSKIQLTSDDWTPDIRKHSKTGRMNGRPSFF